MRRAVFTQKGGVGKSSVAVNLAAASAKAGLKTLLVDLDVQGNSTHYIVGEPTEALSGVEEFFQKQLSLYSRESVTSLIHQSVYNNLSVMPSGRGLLELEHKLESRYKMYKLKECLDELMQDFDRIYLDTPPALNFFSRSAMIAADRVVVPFDCDTFSKQALYQLTETIEEIKADSLPVSKRTRSPSVIMRESHEKAKPLVYLKPKHRLSLEFEALFQELESKR